MDLLKIEIANIQVFKTHIITEFYNQNKEYNSNIEMREIESKNF